MLPIHHQLTPLDWELFDRRQKEKAVNRNRQMTFNKFTSMDEQGISLLSFSQNLRSTDDDDVGRMQMVSRKVSAKKSHIDFRQFSSSPRILFPLAIQFKAAASSHTVPVAIPKWNDSDIIELNSNWTLFRPLVCLCEGEKGLETLLSSTLAPL